MYKYKVILFDLWDTIAEISDLDVLKEEVKTTLGEDRYAELKKHFVKWHLVNKTEKEFLKDLDREISISKSELPLIETFLNLGGYEKYPETDEALRLLREAGMTLILVTNSPPTSKEAFANLNLPQFFERSIFSCDVGLMKPDREIFKRAIEDIDVSSKDVLMVGDSLETDVGGAIDAGLDAILLDRKNLIKYENKVSNLLELFERVK